MIQRNEGRETVTEAPEITELEKRQAGLAQESHVRHLGGLNNLKGIGSPFLNALSMLHKFKQDRLCKI